AAPTSSSSPGRLAHAPNCAIASSPGCVLDLGAADGPQLEADRGQALRCLETHRGQPFSWDGKAEFGKANSSGARLPSLPTDTWRAVGRLGERGVGSRRALRVASGTLQAQSDHRWPRW